MHFSVLGPMEARSDGGAPIELGGPKQRAVLALLVAAANQVVDTERLVEEIWPDGPVGSKRKSVQAYVARLRGELAGNGADGILRAVGGGYLLEVESDDVDLRHFERDVWRGRALVESEPSTAAALLRSGLELWRGRPFEDVHPTVGLEAEASRLEELRMLALEARIEADLAVGRHAEVVVELETLVAANPVRESMWALLMIALYRCGRQADALRRARQVRHLLAEEVGVDPGPELRRVEQQVLAHDPALDAPPVTAAPARQPPPRARRRRLAAWIAAAFATAAALVITLVVVRTGGSESGLRVVATYDIPTGATDVVAAGAALWVLDPDRSTIVSFDPTTGDSSTIELPDPPSTLAADRDVVWVASEAASSLIRLDAGAGRLGDRVDGVDLRSASLAAGPEAVWIVREAPLALARVDEEDLDVDVLPYGVGVPVAPDLSFGDGRLWGSNGQIGQVLALDPDTGESGLYGEPLLGQHGALSIVHDRDSVWFSQPTHRSVTKLDASTGEVVVTVSLGEPRPPGFIRGITPYALAGGPGGMWVAQPDRGRVVLLDDTTGAIRATINLDEPVALTAATGRMWVLDRGASQLVGIAAPPCSASPFVGPGADLRACDLGNSVFVGVDLSGADLRWANLHFAALQRADLTDADLLGANLDAAALDGVTWDNTRCPDGTISDAVGGTCAGHLQP